MKRGEGRYNAVVIGAGTAGLVTAAGTAGLGGRTALVEARRMGGDCLNTGCVPSKSLVSTAKQIHRIRNAEAHGLDANEPKFRFERVFEHMRERRAHIAPHDSVERFEGLGVDVFQARARFTGPREVELDDGTRLTGAHFVIATGASPLIPDIPGLRDVPYWTNETFFDGQDGPPDALLVLGGGLVGCELSQVMRRLGVRVTLLTDVDRLLPHDDREASQVVLEAFQAEGIEVFFGCKVRRFTQSSGAITAEVETGGAVREVSGDRLLVAVGRSPNVSDLGLEKAGVRFDPQQGIPVDRSLRTNIPHIHACGDVTAEPFRFTHAADHQARVAVRNILLPPPFPRARVDYRYLPWVTYVDPEVAHFGLREEDAEEQGVPVDVHRYPMSDLDRAITENATRGFVKVVAARGKDRILGATVVADRGGEILHQIMAVARQGGGLGALSSMIHAYPSWAQAAQRVGDAWNRTRLTPRTRALFEWLYRRRR